MATTGIEKADAAAGEDDIKADSASVAAPLAASYPRHLAASFRHTLVLLRRRRRSILAIAITFVPVLIPLAIAFFDTAPTVPSGAETFTHLMKDLYLKAIAPLLALFFGCTLIGEDIESHTIHYMLTRPVPRSAWVLGRFAAYVVFVGGVVLLSLGLAFAACTALGTFSASAGNLRLLAHFSGVLLAAVAVYGALGMFLGAAAKRPVVYSVIFLFGWQRVAMNMPGLADLLTLEKYLTALLPPLPTQQANPVMQSAILEFQKTEYLVGVGRASLVLIAVTAVLVALTAFVVRWREFTPARAAGA